MDNNLSFEEFFAERVKERGFNLKKLSEVSGIATKHLEALASGTFGNLPSSPYFRGYLQRLGEILDFDWEMWWSRFKTAGLVKNSGAKDLPPRNRFLRPAVYKKLWPVIIVIVIVLYFAFQSARIFGKPIVTVTYPAQNPATALTNEILLFGTVKNGGELYLNNEFVQISSDGSWQKNVLLDHGLNSFQIIAKKFLGGETKIVEQIIYVPASTSTPP